MPLERLLQVLVPVIPIEILVRVVAIIVSPRILVTLWAGIGVALLLEQLLELLIVLGGGAETDLFLVAATSGSAGVDVQVVIIQLHNDLQQSLRAAAQVGRDLGADTVRPDPLIPRRQLVHT